MCGIRKCKNKKKTPKQLFKRYFIVGTLAHKNTEKERSPTKKVMNSVLTSHYNGLICAVPCVKRREFVRKCTYYSHIPICILFCENCIHLRASLTTAADDNQALATFWRQVLFFFFNSDAVLCQHLA